MQQVCCKCCFLQKTTTTHFYVCKCCRIRRPSTTRSRSLSPRQEAVWQQALLRLKWRRLRRHLSKAKSNSTVPLLLQDRLCLPGSRPTELRLGPRPFLGARLGLKGVRPNTRRLRSPCRCRYSPSSPAATIRALQQA